MKLAAAAVHVFTGLGALCALLAAEAVAAAQWERVFFWLGVAFLVDGIGGPIARAVDVSRKLPRFSGETIDLVIDYLTYVFVPVLALLAAGRFGGDLAGYAMAALMLLSSLFHFSDERSKSRDLAFVGFPAIWNIVAFYIFALDLAASWAMALVVLAALLTFVPTRWVHPLRVLAWRGVTVAVTVIWSGLAALTLWQGFPSSWPVQMGLLGAAVYGLLLSAWLTRRGA